MEAFMADLKKKITRADVAEQAGVSKAVVTWVLNGSASEKRIPEKTIQRVQRVAEDLGYKPNIWGKLLNTQKSGLLAFVSSDLTDPFTSELIRSTGMEARRLNYSLMLFDLAGDEENLDRRLMEIANSFAEGVILHAPSDLLLNHCQEQGFGDKPCGCFGAAERWVQYRLSVTGALCIDVIMLVLGLITLFFYQSRFLDINPWFWRRR